MRNINLQQLHELLERAIIKDTSDASDLAKDIDDKYALKTDMDIRFKLDFINTSNNDDPMFATEGSAGFDLRASCLEDITIKPLSREIISTGLAFNLPIGFEIQIRPRSGLAAKNGITVLNAPGTIDSDYTGEIKVILFNSSQEDFVVTNGDRIAQAVVATSLGKHAINLNRVTTIGKETQRGGDGFGSTGIQ